MGPIARKLWNTGTPENRWIDNNKSARLMVDVMTARALQKMA